MNEQLCMFKQEELKSDCCHKCEHFATFKEPRTYTNRNDEFVVWGMCCKQFNKNGSYSMYPVYIADGKCKDFSKKRSVKK